VAHQVCGHVGAVHADRVLRLLERDVLPWIGHRPIADIAAPELLAVLRRIESRGALETAHRARIYAGLVFRYALHTGRADRDPASDLRGIAAKAGWTLFGGDESRTTGRPAARLGRLQGLAGRQGRASAGAHGVRAPGELRSARWADIDLDKAEWRFTVPKTKTPHIVPLAPQAVAILRDLQPLTGDGPYVFPCARSTQRPMSDNAILSAMRRMGIDKTTACGPWLQSQRADDVGRGAGLPPAPGGAPACPRRPRPSRPRLQQDNPPTERRKMMADWATFLDRFAGT